MLFDLFICAFRIGFHWWMLSGFLTGIQTIRYSYSLEILFFFVFMFSLKFSDKCASMHSMVKLNFVSLLSEWIETVETLRRRKQIMNQEKMFVVFFFFFSIPLHSEKKKRIKCISTLRAHTRFAYWEIE